MTRKKKTETIQGSNGQEYPVSLLDKQIVKREYLVRRVVSEAKRLSAYVAKKHEAIAQEIQDFLEETADEHGEKWQGNALLTTLDGTQTIEINVKNQVIYDERLGVAGEKIRRWLDDKLAGVKDENLRSVLEQVSSIAKTALNIDGKGKVDRVKLLQLKKFDFSNEPEWEEAMQLITASEQAIGQKQYIRFKEADGSGKLVGIPVDFSGF